ncbi:MAG: hypothetical protein WCC60_24050 [Ilumatobacteraceae bacterium]
MSATVSAAGTPADFDFLAGRWIVHNRRLRVRHAASQDWDEFEATSRFWTLLDGVANVDELDCATRGFKGMSLRTLDRTSGRWSIYWVSSTEGRLLPPVHGGFIADRGEFFGDDMDGDLPVIARFIWTVRPDAPRWEQAFSTDGGTTWETNWIMEFRRP